MARLAQESADDFFLMTGSSKAVSLCITAGAHGAITASSNYLPELTGRVVMAARKNPLTAGPLQSTLTRLSTAVEAHRVPGVKAAAEMTGLRPGNLRKPLRPVPPKDKRAIAQVLKDAGIL
jgi:dihydrodipicolinate synthase/N-acetylneuraminate lyase